MSSHLLASRYYRLTRDARLERPDDVTRVEVGHGSGPPGADALRAVYLRGVGSSGGDGVG